MCTGRTAGNLYSFAGMNITTKFALGTDALLLLTAKLAKEKYTALLEPEILAVYIAAHFNQQALITEINNMSNQWLVVYVDDDPAGYARITTKGQQPPALAGKRVARIADFGILQAYPAPAIREALFEKCLSVCRSAAGIWINEYAGDPLIGYFESKGFSRQQGMFQVDELPLTAVCLVKEQGD